MSLQQKSVELGLLLAKSSLSAVTDAILTDACGSWINSMAQISTGSGESNPLLGQMSAILNKKKKTLGDERACGDEISQEEITSGFHSRSVTSKYMLF